MRAAGEKLAAAVIAAALASCSWGAFDDLKKDAWVQIVERDSAETGGDFGLEVLAMPPPAGENGIRYVIAVGNPPAGMAQATFDGKGELTEQIGFNAQMGGRGQLEPLGFATPVFSMVRYGDETFLAGSPGAPGVIRYQMGLEQGLQIVPDPRPNTGRTVVAGNLGLGSANPDVVALGILTLTVIPNGDKTPIVCDLKPPNPASSASNHPVVPAESLILVRFGGDSDHIVVSADNLNNEPHIFIFKASDIRNGQSCPETGFAVPGLMSGTRKQGPVSLAAGDVDGNGKLDLVTGSLVSGGGTGVLTVYLDVTPGQAPAAGMTIPAMDPEDKVASGARGSRLRIANIDDTAGNELIVGDAGASFELKSAAGQVYIYRWGACGTDGGALRGPACLVRTLFDPSPRDNDQFGRAMAVGKFKSASGEKDILAVAAKEKLWVFFRTSPTTVDPRE